MARPIVIEYCSLFVLIFIGFFFVLMEKAIFLVCFSFFCLGLAIGVKVSWRKRYRGLARFLAILLVLILFTQFFLLSATEESWMSMKCSLRLRELYGVLHKYAEDHNGYLPYAIKNAEHTSDWRSVLVEGQSLCSLSYCMLPCDLFLCPSKYTHSMCRYVAALSNDSVWKSDGSLSRLSDVSLPSQTALLIEINDGADVERNKFGDLLLDETLKTSSSDVLYGINHINSVFFEYTKIRVLMTDGSIRYYHNPLNVAQLHTLFSANNNILIADIEGYSDSPFSAKPKWLYLGLGWLWLAFAVLYLCACPRMSLSSECPTTENEGPKPKNRPKSDRKSDENEGTEEASCQ